MSRKLLVPLDGSKASEAVLPWAEAFARITGSSLVLARVILSRRYAAEYLTTGVHRQHTMTEWQTANAYLEHVQHALESRGFDVQTVVREGVVVENILDVADEVRASAISLCTHGRHGLARFFLGSIAEGLIHEATIPLLIIPAEAGRHRATPGFGRILVPLDGSDLAERALEYAEGFLPGTSTTLVHVVTPEAEEVTSAEDSLLLDPTESERLVASARSYVEGVADQLHGAGRRAYVMTMSGKPARQILLAAHAAEASAIVMTTHGRTGPGRWRLGSVADEVVRNGDRPVLLINTRTVTAQFTPSASMADIIGRDFVTLHSGDSVALAVRKILRRPGRSAPVVDSDGRLLGLLSERDLLAWASSGGRELIASQELARRADQDSVASLLATDAITLDYSAPIGAGIRAMLDQRVDSLPVVRQAIVAGVVTSHDLLAALVGGETAPEGADDAGSTPAAGNEEERLLWRAGAVNGARREE
jgi:nucleotide-binding universal stress UspA family protein